MGYYTDYTLTVPADVPKKRCEEINKIVNGWYVFTDFLGTEWYGNAQSGMTTKWICAICPVNFPTSSSASTEKEKIGTTYGMPISWAGRQQFCPAQVTITYESFDPEKLEEVSSYIRKEVAHECFDSEVREQQASCKQCQTQKEWEQEQALFPPQRSSLRKDNGKRGVVKLWNTN